MAVIKEFKEFISKGNVVDLAVGVIIGGAFGQIVTSLVNDILMPPIGLLLSGVDFKDLHYKLKDADTIAKKPEVDINYGAFINHAIDFIIIAFCIFLVVKGMNAIKKPQEVVVEAAPEPPTPTKEEMLLTEIRDLLAKK